MKADLIVNGAAGRMGRRVLALALEEGEFDIIAAIDRPSHAAIGKDAGILAGTGEIGVKLDSEYPATADVMIDFSLAEAADKIIDYCVSRNVGLVMGTTGLSENQIEKVCQAGEKIAVVRANNFSVGMNILFGLVGKIAKMLGEEYDIEIVEAHHRFKKDSPSGTALTLAGNIAKQTGRDYPDCLVHGRSSRDALRKKGTIGMHAIRAGDIIGEHSVIFSTLGETMELSHRVHNRDNFARGTLRAARWLRGKDPGLYSMADVLDIT